MYEMCHGCAFLISCVGIFIHLKFADEEAKCAMGKKIFLLPDILGITRLN